MQKSDKIVTIAGIHGTINKLNEDGTLLLETRSGSYIMKKYHRYGVDS
jgi:preprotein translocase subunit YajC